MIVTKIIKLKNKISYQFICFYYTNLYLILFKIHPSIKIRKRILITGKLLLKIDPECEIIFDGFVRINSGHKVNPFFGERKMLINVNKNALLKIGDYVGISNSSIYCTHKIIIEDNVLIGGGCQIYDSNFHSTDFKLRIDPNSNDALSKPIIIKEGAFIGGGSHICKGVTIGSKSIIASGSVVVSSIPSNEMWGGNPAKFIKSLN